MDDLFAYMVLRQVRGVGTSVWSRLGGVPGCLSATLAGDLRYLQDKHEEPLREFLRDRVSVLEAGKRATQQLGWLCKHRVRVLHRDSEEYPRSLADIPDPPAWLFVWGCPEVLRVPAIAIVGSRNASGFGRDLAFVLGRELASLGMVVVSGLARGIDTAAHRGALEAQGQTLAVFGCGLDRTYPADNAVLSASIRKQGACVSEYPPGAPPRAYHFPERNRIIAGLCLGVVVVEATLKSGSLITARLACEYNREVFAIPGSVSAERSRGCHFLIKQGAKLAEGLLDIVEEIPQIAELSAMEQRQRHVVDDSGKGPVPRGGGRETEDQDVRTVQLLALLADGTMAVEDLGRKLHMEVPELLQLLTELELEDQVIRSGAGYRLRATVG